jgi:AcrR family transcriptional regulator
LFRNERYEFTVTRQVRNPEARMRVVHVAWRVVAAEGIHGATMRRIAAEAGVTTGFVTHYFEDKQELLAEVVRYNNGRARDRVAGAIGERRGLVALESAVESLLPLDADRRREWEVWVAAWRPSAAGEPLTDELRGGRRGVERLLRGLLEQAVADEELPAALDVAHEAERLVTLVAGIGLTAGVEAPKHTRRAAKRMLAEEIANLERQLPVREEIER